MKKLIIVAPTYNEEDNIASFISAVFLEQKNLPGYDLEILVSDSHSTDQTPEIVKNLAVKDKRLHYLDVQKRGLGLGLSKGLDFASQKLGADFLVTMEADLSNNPDQLTEFLQKLTKVELVVGSRYTNGGKIINWSLWRKVLSRTANLILMILAVSLRIHEFTNLYRAFTVETWSKLRAKVSIYQDWLFVPAFIFEALDAKIKMREQAIIYYDRFGGRSKMQTVSYTKNLLRYALRYRLHKLRS